MNQEILALITVISLIGTPLAILQIWIIFRGNRLSYIVIDKKIITILKSYIPLIKILINDNEVLQLTETKFAIWNDGFYPIRRNDVVESDPIKIKPNENVKIISSEISYFKNKNSDVNLKNNGEDYLEITFNYLNRGDGFILKLLHTGNSYQDIPISGSIIGGEIKKKEKRIVYLSRQYIPVLGYREYHQRYLGYILMPFFIFSLLFFSIFLILDPSILSKIIGILFLLPTLFLIKVTIPNIPKDLEIIERT
ncbi:hypothetical protein DSECCO2_93170 [anaerobic digester metagenome]